MNFYSLTSAGFSVFFSNILEFLLAYFLLIALTCYLSKTYFWWSSCQQVIFVPFHGEDLGNWIWTFHLSPVMSNGLTPLTFSFCSCYRGREIPSFSLLNFITYIFEPNSFSHFPRTLSPSSFSFPSLAFFQSIPLFAPHWRQAQIVTELNKLFSL